MLKSLLCFLQTYKNSFRWATDCGCKDLILKYGLQYLDTKKIKKVLDVGSGKNEEICSLVPNAEEFHFIDNMFLPEQKPRFHLHLQSAGQKFRIDSETIDLVVSNGSFDHLSGDDQKSAFLEIERVLKKGGIFLFACEYFDFDDETFFEKSQNDPDAKKRNVCSFCNINLLKIIKLLTKLRPIQKDLRFLPDGRPLKLIKTQKELNIFSGTTSTGLTSIFGSFFIVFKKL
jgi:SAM-dependent methyltransferase